MPHLVVTWDAARNIDRCIRFLEEKSPSAAKRAEAKIKKEINYLKKNPRFGRYWSENKAYRELIIPFGAGAYLALYFYDEKKDEVQIVAFRHGKENLYFSQRNFLEKE